MMRRRSRRPAAGGPIRGADGERDQDQRGGDPEHGEAGDAAWTPAFCLRAGSSGRAVCAGGTGNAAWAQSRARARERRRRPATHRVVITARCRPGHLGGHRGSPEVEGGSGLEVVAIFTYRYEIFRWAEPLAGETNDVVLRDNFLAARPDFPIV